MGTQKSAKVACATGAGASKRTFNKQPDKTPMPCQPPVQRRANFDEVALGYSLEEAINEAHRCIHCPKSPCVLGCPVGVPVSEFIAKLADGDLAGAYASIKSTNALPAICGRVCPQESQCEALCTRGRNGQPVAIGRLERFVADWARAHPEELEDARNDRDGRDDCDEPLAGTSVAMVGSGPASLTCAGELARKGARTVVFEALHEVGGVLVYGIPEFRLPKDLVRQEVGDLVREGVLFEKDVVMGKLYTVDELMDQMGFDAVFIGTGAGLPLYLGIEGESLNGVSVANELLTRVNLMKAYRFPEYVTPVHKGKRCVVVGGGNVAMDAARTARRLGADVTVVYRRSFEEMPARSEEIEHAQEEGVNFSLLTNPVRAIGDSLGWVHDLECIRMELGEPDEDGRRRPREVPGSEFTTRCDMLIVAIGSRPNPLIAQTTEGLALDRGGVIATDADTGATSKPGVFCGGDAATGSATVILAMGAGKRAARSIEEYLLKRRVPIDASEASASEDGVFNGREGVPGPIADEAFAHPDDLRGSEA